MQARRFEHEDELTPEEHAEAVALFRPGKWKRGLPPQIVFAKQRAAFQAAEEGLPVTVLDKPARTRPAVTAVEVIALVAVTGGAFLFGRWWGRRRKRQQRAVGLHGLDVFAGG